ncbi:MAG: SNF2 family DNA or RNA helicase [Francisella sp.]|jgi:SNF2 family DNA or RNA helicase
MNLTTNDIKRLIGSTYFMRGMDYYLQKKVIKYNGTSTIEGDVLFISISSTVKGSGRSSYTQSISIQKEYKKNDRLTIESSCSCPVGHNCKHVAAACIAYASQKSLESGLSKPDDHIDDTQLVDNWLGGMKTNTSNSDAEMESPSNIPNKNDYFLTYRLESNRPSEKSSLSFYKSKFLKNGSISKGVSLDFSSLNYVHNNSELKNQEDIDILKLCKVFESDRYYLRGTEVISGKIGATLIRDVIATNRCYFDENLQPLKLAKTPLHVEYEFKLYKGQYTLKSNIDAKKYTVLETQRPYLIDTLNNTVHELDIELEFYKSLLNAPKIQKDNLNDVFSKIANTLPTIDIKTPKSIKAKSITTEAVPRIHIKQNSFSIDFLYDEYGVSYLPRKDIQSFYDKDSKIDIQRDLSYEDSIKETIEKLGFITEIHRNNLIVSLDGTDRQKKLTVWKKFLQEDVLLLQDQGWIVIQDDSSSMKFESTTEVVVDNEDKGGWFDLSFNLEFDGVSQPIAPLISSIIDEFNDLDNLPEYMHLEIKKNHFVEVKSSQIKPIIETIIELFDKKNDDNLRISPYDAHLIQFMDENIIWRGSKEILELSNKLKDFKGIKKALPPKCLNATLRDYQQEGLNWLNFLYEFKFGGILADDMGLGKTIQTLAHLSRLKEDGNMTNKSLIVMPTSLISNWKNEAKKFTPNLKVLSLHGSDRVDRFEMMDDYDILLTTYPLITRDEDIFKKQKFMYIILDEAQKVKNHKTKMAIAIKTFKAEYRLALSGTPIENHLGELWSIFSFIMPGFLDTASAFKKYYQSPIEKDNSYERQNLLNKRVKPFVIRRTKEKVACELPAKSEIIKYTQFGEKQSKLYESIRVTMEARVREAVLAKGVGSSHITILDALLKLRQVCCDPSLLKLEQAKKVQESAKLELFLDLIDELLESGRKILVFSQFTSMLGIIEAKIIEKKVSYTKLTGSTRKREEAIERFTSGEADVFLISLKAGGVGLNLTEADTVIHYDPWWNPAVESQATDRAYRIGQDKPVFVYKLIVANTIEQKILEMQERKRKLQDSIYDGDKQQDDIKFSGNELLKLLE